LTAQVAAAIQPVYTPIRVLEGFKTMSRMAHRLFSAVTLVTLATVLVFTVTSLSVSIASAATGQSAYSPDQVGDTFKRYCVTCHNKALQTARLELDNLNVHQVSADAPVWEKVMRKLRNGQMPPAGMPRPELAVYDGLIAYLETELDSAAKKKSQPGPPGRTPAQPGRVQQCYSRLAGTAGRWPGAVAGR
jgi:mono/diheme cytochrome c family protein